MEHLFWTAIALQLALAYLVVQIVRDFRRTNYVMAVVGSAVAILVLMAMSTPIETHAVVVDMGVAGEAGQP